MAALIPYAPLDTQFGVVCDHRPDGGVVITIPQASERRRVRARAVAGGRSVSAEVDRFFDWLFRGILQFRPPLPRAVLELTPEAFVFTSWAEEDGGPTGVRRAWPRREITELRANRYSNGLYLRVPGQIDTDLLIDLDPPLVKFLGKTLEEAMARLEAGDHAST